VIKKYVLLSCHISWMNCLQKGGSQEHTEQQKNEEEERHIFWPFWHHWKMAVTWLYSTLLISICSFCRGQHAYVNIWSILLFFRFSGAVKKSALIAILKTPSGSISFNSWLRCGGLIYHRSLLRCNERNTINPPQSVYSASQTSRNRTSNRQRAKSIFLCTSLSGV